MENDSIINIEPDRLMGLSDGIFGMVMTLLIFSISIPISEFSSDLLFHSFIQSMAPMIFEYITCFIIVASFWVCHHEYIRLKKLTTPLIWLNIIFLISICFIPFTMLLIEQYGGFREAELIFGLNILTISVILVMIYIYSMKMDLLEGTNKETKYFFNTLNLICIATVIITVFNLIIEKQIIYLYLVIPIVSSARDIYFRRLKVKLKEKKARLR